MGKSPFIKKKDCKDIIEPMESVKKYYKYVIGGLVGLLILYVVIYVATPKPVMSELDKYKLDQLSKDINLILENQKKLDKQIEGYRDELSKIDSTIAKVQNQKVIIREYYKEIGKKITSMNPSEIDNYLHKRYNY
jgi:septal ring factor EnvC (AmiA/AmiB activator)